MSYFVKKMVSVFRVKHFALEAFLICSATILCISVANSTQSKVIVCYLATWSTYRDGDGKFDIEDIDGSLCTHVIYAFAKLDNDTIASFDSWLDVTNNGYSRFVSLKESNSELKTLISIGGKGDGSEKYSNMASNTDSRRAFINSTVEFLLFYGFDGLSLDWVYPTQRGGRPEDRQNFALLISELHQAFHKHGFIVTATIGVNEELVKSAYDFSVLCRDLDFINLIMYDLHGPWYNITGHHASMYTHPSMDGIGNSLDESLQVIMEYGGCPEKMVLGMALFASTFTLSNPALTDIGSPTTGEGEAGPFTKQKGMLGYNEVCLLHGYSVHEDNYSMAPWAFNNEQWICYDDPASIHFKSLWAVENYLMGAMVWSVDTDDFRGHCNSGKFPLLKEINHVLRPDIFPTAPTSSTIDEVIDFAKIICYYGSWAAYREGNGKFDMEDVDPHLCTHVVYSFAKLDNVTFEIVPSDSWLDLSLNGYRRFVALKKVNPKLKVMLSVGGSNEGSEKYSNMVTNESSRSKFIQSAVSMLNTHGFDGLDVGWQYPGNRGGRSEDKENFALLITEMRIEFSKYDLLLSAAIGVQQIVLDTAYNFTVMCRDLDFINLMTYDLHGSWDNVTGHHTSLYNHPNLGELGNSLTQSLSNIKSVGGCVDKMALGMATYGRTYSLVNPGQTNIGSPTAGDGEAGPYTSQQGVIGYNERCLLSEYSVSRDEYTMSPWAYKDNQWICYDDRTSIAIKSEWALKEGLAGGMIWSIETDDFRNECGDGPFPLLSTIKLVFQQASNLTTTISLANSTTAASNATESPIYSANATNYTTNSSATTTTATNYGTDSPINSTTATNYTTNSPSITTTGTSYGTDSPINSTTATNYTTDSPTKFTTAPSFTSSVNSTSEIHITSPSQRSTARTTAAASLTSSFAPLSSSTDLSTAQTSTTDGGVPTVNRRHQNLQITSLVAFSLLISSI